MKRYMIFLLIAIFSTSSLFSQTKISATQAINNVGDTVTVCDKVVTTDYILSEEGKPTYLYLGSQAGSQVIILIKDESRKKFDYKPEKDLLNREICVTGKLISIDGKLHIVVSKQAEINIKN